MFRCGPPRPSKENGRAFSSLLSQLSYRGPTEPRCQTYIVWKAKKKAAETRDRAGDHQTLPTELLRLCQTHSQTHKNHSASHPWQPCRQWAQGSTGSHASLDEALPADGGGRLCSTALYVSNQRQAARMTVRLGATPIQRMAR